ncbi:unnamed protein product [Arabis nemorensis]|uniref:Uncharacterized protein n=1 Tax=Arabis nemorensis TaxID=586526 RepID=A0A565BJS8_9BRAS|nr:unnamed protein product [Arabis nemorensis]
MELVTLLQGKEPPILAEEMKNLKDRGVKYARAYKSFDSAAAALKAELRIQDITDEFTASKPIELSPARVGVRDQFGSNEDNLDLPELSS